MTIRVKLTALLLVITVAPLLLLAWSDRNAEIELAERLAARTEESLRAQTVARLDLALGAGVDHFSQVTERARQIALSNAAAMRAALDRAARNAGLEDDPWLPPFSSAFENGGVGIAGIERVPSRYFRLLEGGEREPMDVSFAMPALVRPFDGSEATGTQRRAMSELAGVLRDSRSAEGSLILRQVLAFSDGRGLVHPGSGVRAALTDMPTIARTLTHGRAAAATPSTDPDTGRPVVTVSEPVPDMAGETVGVAAVQVSTRDLLESMRLERLVVPGAVALLMQDERALAFGDLSSVGERWTLARSDRGLSRPEAVAEARAVDDGLEAIRREVVEGPLRGRPALWAGAALSPDDQPGLVLLLGVPLDRPLGDAEGVRASIGSQSRDQLGFAIATALLMVLVATVVAALASRTVTRPIRRLRRALDEMATGETPAAGIVKRRDELGRLAGALTSAAHAFAEQITSRQETLATLELRDALTEESVPEIEKIEICARTLADRAPAGDCLTAAALGGDAGSVIAILDPAGRGPRAVMRAASARAILRDRAGEVGDPSALLVALNRAAASRSIDPAGPDSFMSVLALSFRSVGDEGVPEVGFSGAGCAPCLFMPAPDTAIETLDACGLPAGVDEGSEYATERRLLLRRGALVVAVTNGLLNAGGNEGEFGFERLSAIVRARSHEPAEVLADAILDAVRAHAEGAALNDDAVVLVAKRVE